MPRVHWNDMPGGVRGAVEERTGPVLAARTASEGLNCELAAVLHTPAGIVFAKGRPSDHAGVVTQHREAMINPYVLDVAPRLLCQVDTDGWNVLAFEYVPGQHADYTPGSGDLPKVVHAMCRLENIPCPDLPLKRAEHRWADYVEDTTELDLLRGDTLLHTDFNPLNILISDTTIRIIDWAWPTRGAAFIDPACLALRLVTAGHPPADAEAWASQSPAWTTAPRKAIDTFTQANARLWQQIARDDPQPWKTTTAAAARQLADHRSR
jgi:hypothetical protein